MADEKEKSAAATAAPQKKSEGGCPPSLPGWFATYADMVTLLLTFFVLLLSFAKTETSKYESALGSLRDSFGGNVLLQGEVIQQGKSPDDYPTMIESQQPIKPFPIEFLTMEGILDKHEINRASTEDLKMMREDLKDFELAESVEVYEMPEGIKVVLKDSLIFKEGSAALASQGLVTEVYKRLVKMLSNGKWVVFVQGHAARGETSTDGKLDAFSLSSLRASEVTRSLIERGVPHKVITTVFYGDSRPLVMPGKNQSDIDFLSRRVEFSLGKTDLTTLGHKVYVH